jgi:hypothetical protein
MLQHPINQSNGNERVSWLQALTPRPQIRKRSGRTFSMLYLDSASDATSTASCCMSSDMSAFLITAFLCSAIVLGIFSGQSNMKLGDKRDDLVHVLVGYDQGKGKMKDDMSSLWPFVASSPNRNTQPQKTTKSNLEMTASQSIR